MGEHEDLMAGDDLLRASSVNVFGANIEGVEAAAPEEDAVEVTPDAGALGRVHQRVIVLEGESQKAKDQLEEAKKKPEGVSCQVLHALVVWAFLLGAFLMAAYAVSQISSQPTYETTVTGTWVGNATAVSTSGVSASSVTAVLSTDTDGVVTGTIGNAVIGMVGSDANSSPPGEISLVETGYMDEYDHWVSGTATYTGYLDGSKVLYLTQYQTGTTPIVSKMRLYSTVIGAPNDSDETSIVAFLVIVCSVLVTGACLFAIFKAKLNIDDPKPCLYPDWC